MTEPTKEILSDGTPVRTEEPGFTADELVACPVCSRMNPPTRGKCLYCGARIGVEPGTPLSETSTQPLESWQHGFELIVNLGCETNDHAISLIADTTGTDSEVVAAAFELTSRLPVARVATIDDAREISSLLETKGIDTVIVPDVELMLGDPPVRLRGIVFRDDDLDLIDFNTGDAVTRPYADISLVVTGTIVNDRIERLETRKGRGRSETSDDGRIMSSFRVMDLYAVGDSRSYRIVEYGFDYSCLGDAKSQLAGENMSALIDKFADLLTGSVIDTGYDRLRAYLDHVWSIDERTDSRGIVKSGLFKREISRAALTTNLVQFQRYSRMQRHIR